MDAAASESKSDVQLARHGLDLHGDRERMDQTTGLR